MNAKILFRAVAVWIVLMAVETVHGIARTLWLAPRVGEFRARQIAVFTGSILLLAAATALIRWIHPRGTRDEITIGVLWLILTIGFEISVGHILLHLTWSRILSDYDLARGGLLPIGLIVLTLSPWIAARIRSQG